MCRYKKKNALDFVPESAKDRSIDSGVFLQMQIWELKLLVWEKPAFLRTAEVLPALLRLGRLID